MKFNKGDKVMGFHESISNEILKSGIVLDVKIGEGIASRDRYFVGTEGLLNDSEAVKYDKLNYEQSEIFLKRANELERQAIELRKIARLFIYMKEEKI